MFQICPRDKRGFTGNVVILMRVIFVKGYRMYLIQIFKKDAPILNPQLHDRYPCLSLGWRHGEYLLKIKA